jgi:hypothetical protein
MGRSVAPPPPKQAKKPANNFSNEADKLIGQLTRPPQPRPEPAVAETDAEPTPS